MAAQSSVREELDVLRRKEWARRNQETQQDKELYQESTPLFREPYKTNKGDELSSRIQKMLGNYEDGNNLQYNQYEAIPRDRPPSSSHGRSGHFMNKDKKDPSFQGTSSYGSTKQGQSSGHSSSQPSKKFPILDFSIPVQSKQGLVKTHETKTDPWAVKKDYATLPPVLPDLSPPAEPLSPLHSSESEQDMEEINNAKERSLSPHCKGSSERTVPSHNPETQQKEVSHLGGDAPMPASQTFPLPLSSKPNLANSRKPMALVRPMDGPDQVNSESPDLKPSPNTYHGQSYENLSDLKTSVSKPNLPPLKIPSQSVEMLSNEVQRVEEILREMTHSWPPLLTAIQTPSTAEPSKFSFPNKESSVHRGYQPQKHSESPPKAPPSPVHQQPAECEDGGRAVSSDSESSSESESDSESSDSGTDETPTASRSNTSPAKAEGLKDINWQLISWIKESQPSLNPQNHADVSAKPNSKPATSTKSQTHTHAEEDQKPKNKKHYNSRTPPAQPELGGANPESKPAPVNQDATHKPAPNAGTEAGTRKTDQHLSKSTKAHSSLHVESVEVTPRNKDATFTERPKVKTKTSHEKKSESRKSAKCCLLEKRDRKEVPAKAGTTVLEEKKEAEPVRLSSPSPKNSVTVTHTPSKNSKKSRARSPTTDKKSKSMPSKFSMDLPLALVVKIQLSHLSRIPQVPKATKTVTSARVEKPLKKSCQEKDPGKVSKKRPADHSDLSVPKKKLKLEKDREGKASTSSQHNSIKIEAPRSSRDETDRKSSEKVHAPVPLDPGHKRRCGDMEESSGSSSKHKKKSSSREERNKSDKKAPKKSSSAPESSSSCGVPAAHRPLLKFDDKPYSVDHHMKEAKKLKHKADAMVDKMGKALSYLDAAMSFVESGIAMETDPQTPKSAYTMFSDTVDLIRFILKLKNYLDPSAPASERDFLVLCMRCQALLQMAMFRCKRESAMKYSRTLTDYFKSSKTMQAPSPCISKGSSPMSPMPSPASSIVSNPGSSGSTVSIPQLIQQMASSYINITALFLSAHETWEQAEELARTRTGLLSDLDKLLGRLSLTSSMTALVRYTLQGLHWLRLDNANPRSDP
ncbi:hypothetical protein Q7C36_018636 [Tachysurus vachellii]|uniref:AF4/FMR2 C-terminal homology domain-containing protein n=1 Tax=Tachysurus vachellii TaxID=175792 RepID=A0AA88S3Y9_TACVA|nr:AF4/FMR2 family member 1 [Tachysurus vachellii]KAK2827710.1 hypothetical protein Q7C36_018636 [Tachysurus vachellii]